jgi:drug/metabolite transporter (DMT)-like permease
MIARAGRSNSPATVIFYFCVTATLLHLVAFAALGVTWPVEQATWLLLLAAGVTGSVAQVFLTKAYQSAPAALNSAVSYLGPVFNLAFGMLFFARTPDSKAFVGAAVVLVFGVILPFVKLPAARGVPIARSI